MGFLEKFPPTRAHWLISPSCARCFALPKVLQVAGVGTGASIESQYSILISAPLTLNILNLPDTVCTNSTVRASTVGASGPSPVDDPTGAPP
jgi:hypothetical protein